MLQCLGQLALWTPVIILILTWPAPCVAAGALSAEPVPVVFAPSRLSHHQVSSLFRVAMLVLGFIAIASFTFSLTVVGSSIVWVRVSDVCFHLLRHC